jgi:hypothetical protein
MKGIGNKYRKRREEYKYTKVYKKYEGTSHSMFLRHRTCSYFTLHYIAFPGSKVSRNNCRMWSMSYKYKNMCTVQVMFSHNKTPENTVVTHEGIQKYIHIYTSILSTHAIYTAFEWMSHFVRQEVCINSVE